MYRTIYDMRKHDDTSYLNLYGNKTYFWGVWYHNTWGQAWAWSLKWIAPIARSCTSTMWQYQQASLNHNFNVLTVLISSRECKDPIFKIRIWCSHRESLHASRDAPSQVHKFSPDNGLLKQFYHNDICSQWMCKIHRKSRQLYQWLACRYTVTHPISLNWLVDTGLMQLNEPRCYGKVYHCTP